MSDIQRHHTNQRMSQIVTHGDTIYLAGQVGTAGASVAQQTQDCLDKVDALLAVWDAWVPEGHAPARACGEAKLAKPDFTVEILVIAAAS